MSYPPFHAESHPLGERGERTDESLLVFPLQKIWRELFLKFSLDKHSNGDSDTCHKKGRKSKNGGIYKKIGGNNVERPNTEERREGEARPVFGSTIEEMCLVTP